MVSATLRPMETREIRLKNLLGLLGERFGGVVAEFARAIGKDPNQARFILNPQKAGGRWVGERLAREIEEKLALGRGWLDEDHGGGASEDPEREFLDEIAQGIASHEVPDHIKQTIKTLISSSPKKKKGT